MAAKGVTAKTLDRVRSICLAFPEAHEKEAWGAPTFRVRDKLFAMFEDDHHGSGRLALWCKALPGAQEALVAADPRHFFVPPYVGKSGWIGVNLDSGLDWGAIGSLLEDGYRMTAPKRLLERADRGAEDTRAVRAPATGMPDELARLIATNARARRSWDAMTEAEQRTLREELLAAKQSATRTRRARKALLRSV